MSDAWILEIEFLLGDTGRLDTVNQVLECHGYDSTGFYLMGDIDSITIQDIRKTLVQIGYKPYYE